MPFPDPHTTYGNCFVKVIIPHSAREAIVTTYADLATAIRGSIDQIFADPLVYGPKLRETGVDRIVAGTLARVKCREEVSSALESCRPSKPLPETRSGRLLRAAEIIPPPQSVLSQDLIAQLPTTMAQKFRLPSPAMFNSGLYGPPCWHSETRWSSPTRAFKPDGRR